MKKTEYTKDRQMKWNEIEEKSWWFQYRINVFVYLANKYLDLRHDIYDIGGSNGYNALRFQQYGYKVHLLEPTEQACKNAKSRGIKNVLNTSLEEYNGNIDNFLLLDVLEHIEDDGGFLQAIYSKMHANGFGILSVPACMSLWSSEDEVDGHFRRYDANGFLKVLRGSGFQIIYMNYLYQFLWIPIYLRRHLMEQLHLVKKVRDRTVAEEDAVTKKQFISEGFVNKLLWAFINREYERIKIGEKIPYGSSLVSVVKKCDTENILKWNY